MIELKGIKALSDTQLDKLKQTYMSSFPIEERRDFDALKQLIISSERFTAYAIIDEEYKGVITVWDFDTFCYVEHFAIEQNQRGKGIGMSALKKVMADKGKPFVLEVELPTDDITKRRVAFYKRAGYKLCDISYFQPPYRDGAEWLEMRFMYSGFENMERDFSKIKKTIYKYVYRIDDIENP